MSEKFRIDSYEPFLVGLRLKSNINLDSLEKKMKEVLAKNGFDVPESTHNRPIIGSPSELLGLKNNVEMILNIETLSFNIVGDNPVDVISILNELPNLLEEADYTINDTLVFYEIHVSMVVETGKNPRDVLNTAYDLDKEKISDLKTSVSGLKINSIDDENKLISVIIEPRAGNPNKFYYINLVYRSNELEDLISYSQELEEKVKGLLCSLEGR